MFDITVIIEAVFALLAAVITAIVIPYIKSKTTTSQQAEINAWVKIAVTAAEQIYTGSGKGAEKKAYVLNWLREPQPAAPPPAQRLRQCPAGRTASR